jgi:hypothetical protein
MSKPDIIRGAYIDIAVEEPRDSGTFVKICGLTTKNYTQQKNSSDVFVPDCDDPETPPDRYLNITGFQRDISGDGLYNRAQAPLIRALLSETSSRTWRFILGEPAGDAIDAGYYEGPAQLMSATLGGPGGGEYSTISATIANDGPWVWIDA